LQAKNSTRKILLSRTVYDSDVTNQKRHYVVTDEKKKIDTCQS